MMFTYDSHTCDLRVWCSQMKFTHDFGVWCSQVNMTSKHICGFPLRWISYNTHMWLTCMITDMIIYTHTWYKHMACIYDSIIWLHTNDYHTYDANIWLHYRVFVYYTCISYDTHMWLTYMITDMIVYTYIWYKHI